MAANETASMALFCDFENIALGVRDAQYEKFDIRPVLERLLAKGSIVVKKAYCDWERYRGFKAAMHEANFELIEIPHVRQSGKNSADIRMVVDALDLCYTKSHVDTFVIISGDSDFSPLVSKLRENAKRVIGVGVKQSCSDLLVTNCDEFIYYDDLVRDRESSRSSERREREKRSPEEEAKRREKMEERKQKAVELVSATFADLMADRGEAERTWASVLKEVVKRRNPGFNENYFGFRTFGNLLEEAASRGLLAVGRDEKSGTFVTRAVARATEVEAGVGEVSGLPEAPVVDAAEAKDEKPARRRAGRRNRRDADAPTIESVPVPVPVPVAGEPEAPVDAQAVVVAPAPESAAEALPAGEKKRRGGRRPRKDGDAPAAAETATDVPPAALADTTPAVSAGDDAEPKKAKRAPARPRKPKKKEAAD
ncbi:MAG: NYN domain-containing protein [Azonexaceae bacterium]|nr:NYN domain-containing protein [Azonexaceae bacterium]